MPRGLLAFPAALLQRLVGLFVGRVPLSVTAGDAAATAPGPAGSHLPPLSSAEGGAPRSHGLGDHVPPASGAEDGASPDSVCTGSGLSGDGASDPSGAGGYVSTASSEAIAPDCLVWNPVAAGAVDDDDAHIPPSPADGDARTSPVPLRGDEGVDGMPVEAVGNIAGDAENDKSARGELAGAASSAGTETAPSLAVKCIDNEAEAVTEPRGPLTTDDSAAAAEVSPPKSASDDKGAAGDTSGRRPALPDGDAGSDISDAVDDDGTSDISGAEVDDGSGDDCAASASGVLGDGVVGAEGSGRDGADAGAEPLQRPQGAGAVGQEPPSSRPARGPIPRLATCPAERWSGIDATVLPPPEPRAPGGRTLVSSRPLLDGRTAGDPARAFELQPVGADGLDAFGGEEPGAALPWDDPSPVAELAADAMAAAVPRMKRTLLQAGTRDAARSPPPKRAKQWAAPRPTVAEAEEAMRWCAANGRPNVTLLRHVFSDPACVAAARESTTFQISMLAFLAADVVDLPDSEAPPPAPIPAWQRAAIEAVAHEDVVDCLAHVHDRCVRCRFKFCRFFLQVHGLAVAENPVGNPFHKHSMAPLRADFAHLRRHHSKACDAAGRTWVCPLLREQRWGGS